MPLQRGRLAKRRSRFPVPDQAKTLRRGRRRGLARSQRAQLRRSSTVASEARQVSQRTSLIPLTIGTAPPPGHRARCRLSESDPFRHCRAERRNCRRQTRVSNVVLRRSQSLRRPGKSRRSPPRRDRRGGKGSLPRPPTARGNGRSGCATGAARAGSLQARRAMSVSVMVGLALLTRMPLRRATGGVVDHAHERRIAGDIHARFRSEARNEGDDHRR